MSLEPSHNTSIGEHFPGEWVLKAAIRLLLSVSQAIENQRSLQELLLVFEGVSDCQKAALPWGQVVFDRLSDRYRPSFKLAELFLKQTPPDVTGGGVHAFSLFFEMNSLFEEYIGRMAARVFRPEGLNVTLQKPQRSLAINERTRKPAFSMKPDVVASRNGDVVWILDTKWKELSTEKAKDGVAQSDLYQMYAYASCYQCPEVVLLYLHHQLLEAEAGIRGSYLLHPWIRDAVIDAGKRVKVATIDLRELKTVAEQLKMIISSGGEADVTKLALPM